MFLNGKYAFKSSNYITFPNLTYGNKNDIIEIRWVLLQINYTFGGRYHEEI